MKEEDAHQPGEPADTLQISTPKAFGDGCDMI
jgi:hypothetical protein